MSLPLYMCLSDSDSVSEEDSDGDNYLLDFNIAPPLLKISKTELKESKLSSKSRKKPGEISLVKKPRGPRKANEEKQRCIEEKKKARQEEVRLKARAAEEKRRQKEEAAEEKRRQKEEAAEEKRREKEEKKKATDLLRQLKPKECMKFISTFIDSSLLNYKFGGELLTALRNAEIKYTVREQRVPGTVFWQRSVNDHGIEVQDHILIVWTWEKLIDLIICNNLDITVEDMLQKHSGYSLTILIFEIDEYFRKKKISHNKELKASVTGGRQNSHTTSPRNLSRNDIEIALATLQLMLNVQYRFLQTSEEVGLFVTQFTKAMAELPYKLKRNKMQENSDWYAEADSKECIRVDSSGNGLSTLWQQQLCQFPGVGLDVAQAIASQYLSPTVLVEAYNRCPSQKGGEMLLQDIPVRRTHGPLTSSRRVGPELSRKVYTFFTSTDGNFVLSKES